MANNSQTFVDFITPVPAAWLNDVNSVTYPVEGGIMVGQGNTGPATVLAPGASGYILTSTGTATAPQWANLSVTGFAPINSPAFTGTPTAPTPTLGDNSTKVANTAFIQETFSGYAPLASPVFTGFPEVPTQYVFGNNTEVANLQWVNSRGVAFPQIGGYNFTTNTVMTSSYINQWGIVSSSGVTVTLPPLASVPDGSTFTFIKSNILVYTVNCSGSDSMSPTSGNSISIYQGESLQVVANGNSWYISNDAVPATNPYFFGTDITFNMQGAANDGGNIHVYRAASYTGGTAGTVGYGMQVETNVSATASSYEWAFIGLMNNSATAGNNVAIYGQGNRQTTTTGPTWAGVMEARETVPIANPTSGTIGLEVDVRGNGTDSNFQRIGIDVVCTRYNASGAATQTGYGVRVQNGSDTNSEVVIGVGIVADNCQVGFDTSGATIYNAALRMAANQAIAFDVNSTNQLTYDGTGLKYSVSGTLKSRLNQDGSIFMDGVHAVQLIPSITASAGAIATYLNCVVDGTTYYIPLYA
jgi:hypothetical protein